jgi:hypothetical protein
MLIMQAYKQTLADACVRRLAEAESQRYLCDVTGTHFNPVHFSSEIYRSTSISTR